MEFKQNFNENFWFKMADGTHAFPLVDSEVSIMAMRLGRKIVTMQESSTPFWMME